MKKNIIFILPELYGGGAEKTVGNLSKKLIDKYNIDIILFRDTPIKYAYSGNLVYLPERKKNNIFAKIVFFLHAIKFLKKYKREHNIDYSISFLTAADIVNVFSKVKDTKNIISIRNTDSILNNKNKLYKMCTCLSTKKSDHIVSISNQVKEDLINNFNIEESKITTIYNPSLAIKFGNMNLKLDEDFWYDPVVINMGRLTHQKGQWHLIKAFSEVVKKNKNCKLIILGEGELKEQLKKIISVFKLENNVFLLGFVDNPYDYLRKADLFVFSSLYEGLGNSIIESLVCGIPVISTDCIAGPREILSPKTDFRKKIKEEVDYAEFGILVPSFDEKEIDYNKNLTKEEKILSKAIEKVINNKELRERYAIQATKRAADFDSNVIADEWKKILK